MYLCQQLRNIKIQNKIGNYPGKKRFNIFIELITFSFQVIQSNEIKLRFKEFER